MRSSLIYRHWLTSSVEPGILITTDSTAHTIDTTTLYTIDNDQTTI